jgi:hypothetical protein
MTLGWGASYWGKEAETMARTVEDTVMLIRDWTDARGCGAYRMLAAMAADAAGIAHYDETHPVKRTASGEIIGGQENARKAHKAARQYRLASWILRQVYEGREAHDARVAAEQAAAEERRIANLPRVDAWGRPV